MSNTHHGHGSFHGYFDKMSSELAHTEKFDNSALVANMRDGCNATLWYLEWLYSLESL